MGHFHSNCAFPSHQLEVLEVPCSGTQTFWPFQVVRHILWRKSAMGILTLTSVVPSFVIFVHLRLRLWRWEDVQGAVSDLSKFLFLFLFFSLTKIYYPFFPPSILMSLRVLHVLHNSTSPSQSCSCDSAGNKSKQGFNSFFFSSSPASQAHPKFCMHGYLFPMPIALGPFPHPSYDTTAGEFLSFSPSSSFSKESGRGLGCVSVLWFSCCKCTWPSMAKTSGKLLFKPVLLGWLPQAHIEMLSHVFSPPAQPCWDGLCSLPLGAQHLLLWVRQEDKSTLSHLLTHWEELEPEDPNPVQCWLGPRVWFPGIAQVLNCCKTK